MPPPPPQELKARNAAGEQARSAPKSAYVRPHRVHTEAEENVAHHRKHEMELDDEAHRRALHDNHETSVTREDEIKEEYKVTGLNFDDERKKKGRHPQDDDEEQQRREEEAAEQLGLTGGRSKLFEDLPEDRMGDLALTNPNEMKRLLGSPMRFAQHAMILTEHQQREQNMPREQAIAYMAKLYAGCIDKSYANKALRQFGAATGVLDVYPVEVMQHLLQHTPGFLKKVHLGSFFAETSKEGYRTEVGKPIVLEYDEHLRIRGFALKGGGRPGYLFEPVDPKGTYHLTFAHAGTFSIAISALSKDGQLLIQDLEIVVSESSEESPTEELRRMVSEEDAKAEAQEGVEPNGDEPEKKDDLKVVIPRYI